MAVQCPADGDREVGFLSESPYFYNYLTAAEFLEFYCKLFDMGKYQIARKIEDLMPLVGLKGKENVRLSKFSRGMLQRIGIAQSLINDPDLIILDEPITGLDPQGRKEVKDIILGLREEGKSVFFSSHVLHDVQEMCTDIGIINKGDLIACKPTPELLDLFSEQVFEFGVDRLPADGTLDTLQGVRQVEHETGDQGPTLVVTTSPETEERSAALYGVVQALEAEDVLLRSISQRQQTLENVFLQLTSDKE